MFSLNEIIQAEFFYVWDNWGFVSHDGVLHIYAQYCEKSLCVLPEDRYWNVHIEHFISLDHGKTFKQRGPVIQKSLDREAFDSYNIWSGCAIPLEDEKVLALYTGLKLPKESLESDRKYALQSIGGAISEDGGYTFSKLDRPLISPIRDYELLQEKGYYLGPIETLGAIDDPDGTFMCLRDPEVFIEDHTLHIIFGAKAVQHIDGKNIIRNAIGHAIIKDLDNIESLEIQRPLFIAKENDYNQLELPNLIKWKEYFYLIISTTKLDYIGQPDVEVEKTVRVYRSTQLIDGDWEPFGKDGEHIILKNKIHKLYGPKLIHMSAKNGVYFFRPFVIGETYAPPTIGIDFFGSKAKVLYNIVSNEYV
ncbi:MAG: hypothetical protein CVU98_00390 [Firmicutes bacterium HGW-Firmicutes-3]|nr:MAG: hypothetical protein CVU98_00390 [Firmicutes bacterium HGW-Firmicutes-3]